MGAAAPPPGKGACTVHAAHSWHALCSSASVSPPALPARHRQQLLLAEAQPLIVAGKLVAVPLRPRQVGSSCSRGGVQQEGRGSLCTGAWLRRQGSTMCQQQGADAGAVRCACHNWGDVQLGEVPAWAKGWASQA